MRAVVTGAAGFIGRALCADLRSRRHEVAEVTRASHGAIEAIDDWSPIVDGADVVFHLAAHVHVLDAAAANDLARFREVNVAATARLLRACARVERFVFLSTIGALRPVTAYAISKTEAEEVVRASGIPFTILRAPLVYGPEVEAKFRQLLGIVRRGLPLPFAGVTSARSMMYVHNLTDALIAAAGTPDALNETFLVADDETWTTPALVRELATLLGKRPRLLRFPQSILRHIRRFEPLVTPFVVDTSRFRQRTGWRPPYTAREGLAATAAWYERETR